MTSISLGRLLGGVFLVMVGLFFFGVSAAVGAGGNDAWVEGVLIGMIPLVIGMVVIVYRPPQSETHPSSERPVIIQREVVRIPCKYCGALVDPIRNSTCPHCGAKLGP